MRHSIVLRLTLIVAVIIAASFLALQWVVYRSTSAAFLSVEERAHPQAVNPERVERIAGVVQRAIDRGGLAAVMQGTGDPGAAGLRPDDAFLVLDPELLVVATTEPVFAGVRATRNARDGALSIHASTAAAEGQQVIDLTAVDPRPLVLANDAAPAYLIVLPEPLDAKAGDQFAASVWRSAAFWLAGVIVLAMFATAVVIRRSLSPIDRLTAAARRLQEGEVPAPLGRHGSAEFAGLFAAFDAATRAIASTEALRKRLISDIAHELRTPVTNLKGQLEALDSGLTSASPEFIATLQAETQLLERLVEDFQQLAVTDAGNLRLNLQQLPLREALESMLAPLAETAQATLDIQVPPDLAVVADEQRLRQVLANLFENALRHRARGLVITLSAAPRAGGVCLKFADNGPGIDPVDRPHVFERFYRAEKSRNRASGGAGLGLPISRGIMQAMGGSIELAEEPCSGACFAIVLPAAVNPHPSSS